MLKDILSISGYGGLFKFISQGRTGIIVESLEDKKRMNASATAKISALEDIAIFTDTEDMPLNDVFKAISEKEAGGVSINHKSSADELKNYFSEVLPDYDRDRVYVSDIKKVINWYNILHKLELLNFEEEKEEKSEENIEEKTDTKEKKEVKKPASKAKTATSNQSKKAPAPKNKPANQSATRTNQKNK